MNFQFSTSTRRNQPIGIGGKLFVSVICLAFFAGGIFITYELGRHIKDSLRTRGWQPTNCTIIRRGISEKSPYTAMMDYTYEFKGKTYKCNTLSIGYHGSDDYYDAQKILDAYPTDTHSICRVNPADPAAAVLQTPSLWIVFEILFPLVFIIIGGGLFYLIWRPPKIATALTNPNKTRAFPTIICGAFFIAGVVMLCLMLHMYQRYRSAQNWSVAACTIVNSSIASDNSGDSTTYSVKVLFKYTFNKTQYESSRYSLTNSSSSGYDGKKQVVDQLNTNRNQICYVNQQDPADAVLDRGSDTAIIILASLGSVFLLIGGGGITVSIRSIRKRLHPDEVDLPPSVHRGPVILRPDVPRRTELLGLWFLALFWNGVVWVFVVTVVQGWVQHHGDIGLTLFLLPFVLVGFGSLIAAICKIGSLFLPTAQLSLSRSPLEIGEAAEIRWQIAGDAGKIRGLKIRSVLFDVSTDPVRTLPLKKLDPVWSEDLLDTARQPEIHSGRRMLTIGEPVPAKDKFKRIWAVQVVYDLGKSKPLREVFPMRVIS